MLISFWSNMHGQAGVSAAAAAFASFIAQKTAYKSLVAHNHFEKNALEGYFLKQANNADQTFSGLSNQGVDALVRLIRNGRLKAEMVPDYTYSLLKNNRLDILLGASKKERNEKEDEETFISILKCAKEFYDLVILDLHSGMSENSSRSILEGSDIIIFCINQNRFLLSDFVSILEKNPFLTKKRSAYVINRYEKQSSLTSSNISRRFAINSKSIFEIPNSVKLSDALNNGRIFDYIAYCQNAKEGEEKDLIISLGKLCDYVIEG